VSGRLEFARDGAFDVSADLAGFVISDRPAVNAVVYGDSAMELLGRWAEGFLRRFRPRGLGDADLRLRGRWDEISRTEVTGRVVCQDISIEDTRFPYRLEGMQGVIAFSGRSLTLDSLVCRHGAWEFIIDGSIEEFGAEMETRLRVVSGEIRFDEDVYRALGAEGKRMWLRFRVGTGRSIIRIGVFRMGGSQRLTVELLDAGAVYEHFPYPLEHLTGQIVFEPNRVSLSHVEAHYADSRKVRLDGAVSGSDDFSMRVRAERIPLDGLLLEAMPRAHSTFRAV
jgi:hypothetical protein